MSNENTIKSVKRKAVRETEKVNKGKSKEKRKRRKMKGMPALSMWVAKIFDLWDLHGIPGSAARSWCQPLPSLHPPSLIHTHTASSQESQGLLQLWPHESMTPFCVTARPAGPVVTQMALHLPFLLLWHGFHSPWITSTWASPCVHILESFEFFSASKAKVSNIWQNVTS